MQSMLNLHGSYGLPLSIISGITQHFAISKEIEDHDRRREAMKKKRSGTQEGQQHMHADQEMGMARRQGFGVLEIGGGELDEDLVRVLHDLSFNQLLFTAKAA